MTQQNNSIDRADAQVGELTLRILDCLDKPEFPAYLRTERAAEVGVAIMEILDRITMPPWDEVPDTA